MWKQLRNLRGEEACLLRIAQKLEAKSASLIDGLGTVLVDRSQSMSVRLAAARILAVGKPGLPAALLMRQFLHTETDLGQIAAIVRMLEDARAIAPLLEALNDANVYRREAAAAALSFWARDPRVTAALIRVLTDLSQPVFVRGQAAESLQGSLSAAAALISVLSDDAVAVRFWAVYALNGQRKGDTDREAVAALEKMLTDDAVYEGWWSVGREALATLGHLNPQGRQYAKQLDEEIQRVMDSPDASSADRLWAQFLRIGPEMLRKFYETGEVPPSSVSYFDPSSNRFVDFPSSSKS